MALLGEPSGSSTRRSSQREPGQGSAVNDTLRVDPRNKYSANAHNYDKLAPIKDTFTTQTSVNPDRYPELYKMLLGYPKGFPMVVPYYHRLDPDIYTHYRTVDLSMDEDAIHEDLELINNFEMKLEEPIQFTLQEEDKSTQLTGTAIMYPGFEPIEGDLFFMEVDNNQSMIFRINSIEPTTFRQERFYRVKFFSYTQLTAKLLERINSAVTEVCHFERRKYFGESQLTFLSDQSWKDLKELERLRKSIAQDTINFFFDRDGASFFRPDRIYDPYITEFLRSKLTVKENYVHPLQLLVPLRDFERSIWYKFILAENCEDLSDVYQFCTLKYKSPNTFASDFNALVGKNYIALSDSGGIFYPFLNAGTSGMIGSSGDQSTCGCVPTDPRYPRLIYHPCDKQGHFPDRDYGYAMHYGRYPQCPVCSKQLHCCDCCGDDGADSGLLFTADFYSGFIDGGTSTLESILYRYLRDRTVDVTQILALVRPYRKLGTNVRAFYTYPLYLELVDAAIVTIR